MKTTQSIFCLLSLALGAFAQAPSGFGYSPSNGIFGCVNQPVSTIPTVTGTGVTFSWGPGEPGNNFSFPPGLNFDPATGAISGTPTQPWAGQNYTVYAHNAQGSVPLTFAIYITATCPASPVQYAYHPPVLRYCKNQVFSYAPFAWGGLFGPFPGVAAATTSPLLPSGLVVGGPLSGIPTQPASSTNHVFYDAGNAPLGVINIAVQNACKILKTTTPNVAAQCAGWPLTPPISPSVSGGPIVQCVAGGLPQGLTVSVVNGTCQVSGTPALGLAGGFWSVIGAMNDDGSTAYDTLYIPLKACGTPPMTFSYPQTESVCKGVPLSTPITPVVSGNAIISCSSSPDIAAATGLTLNSDCSVSGTPNAASAATVYTVTGTSSGGNSSQATLTIATPVCGDACAGWKPQSPAPANPSLAGVTLRSVYFGNTGSHNYAFRIGHIVGYNGTIRVTQDSGTDGWPKQNPPSANATTDLYSVSCPWGQNDGGSTCYAVGANGTILSSASAMTPGTTWSAEALNTVTTSTLRSVSCGSLNSSLCVAVGDGGTILRKTTVGGQWVKYPTSPTTQQLSSVSCKSDFSGSDTPANYLCFAAGNNGTFLKSVDGGSTWALTSIPGFSTVNFNSVQFWMGPAGVAWIAGDHGTLLITQDNGATWTALNPGTGTANLNSVDYGGNKDGWVVGDGGAIAASILHGPFNVGQFLTNPWQVEQGNPPNTHTLHSISTPDTCLAWSVGTNGTILKTTQCGCGSSTSLSPDPGRQLQQYPTQNFRLLENGTLWFTLLRPSKVEAVLYDLRGKEVARITTTIAEAGQHTLAFHDRIRPGTYLLRFRTGEGRSAPKVVVISD